jgi:transposase-like protein
MSQDWELTRKAFQQIVSKQGIRKVADALPAAHTTVYRLIKNETHQPTKALRAAIERIVTQAKDN